MNEQIPETGGPAASTPASTDNDPQSQIEALRKEVEATRVQLLAVRAREVVLRNELLHRVRNMLAITRSIFSRTVANGGTVEDLSNHFHGRLDTLARYQSFQATGHGSSVDFEQMVRDELHSFQFGDDPVISITGPDVRLGHDVALVAALALHELVTNSIKFGVLSTPERRGRLTITWTLSEDLLTFIWAESGVPVLGPAPLHRGFGREFIEQALPYQIGATTSFELRAGGVHCSITMPLEAVAAPL